jgi:hypothetical protein
MTMIVMRKKLAAGLIAACSLVLAACSGSTSGVLDTAGKGRVQIVMSSNGSVAAAVPGSDPARQSAAAGASGLSAASTSHHHCGDPGQALQAANVTFSSILARTLDGKLIDVAIKLPVAVDLLSLVSGREATLPIGFLPPGTYDQIVVVMTKLDLTLESGTEVSITPPGGGWTAIVPVAEPFTVVEGATTTIAINFRKDLSFGCGSGDWEFHPEFECDRGHREP